MAKDANGKYKPETKFVRDGDFIYNLAHQQDSKGNYQYCKGEPAMGNDVAIKLAKHYTSGMTKDDLENLAEHLKNAANEWLKKEFGFKEEPAKKDLVTVRFWFKDQEEATRINSLLGDIDGEVIPYHGDDKKYEPYSCRVLFCKDRDDQDSWAKIIRAVMVPADLSELLVGYEWHNLVNHSEF